MRSFGALHLNGLVNSYAQIFFSQDKWYGKMMGGRHSASHTKSGRCKLHILGNGNRQLLHYPQHLQLPSCNSTHSRALPVLYGNRKSYNQHRTLFIYIIVQSTFNISSVHIKAAQLQPLLPLPIYSILQPRKNSLQKRKLHATVRSADAV